MSSSSYDPGMGSFEDDENERMSRAMVEGQRFLEYGANVARTPRDRYDVARDVTDEVLGEGAYAEINEGNPDPGVRAAIEKRR